MKLSELLEGIENAADIETKINAALADKKCKIFIDDGDKNSGVPSTIVSILEDGSVKLIREGAVKL